MCLPAFLSTPGPPSVTSPISEDTSTKSPDATPAEPAAPRGFLPATVDELKLVVWPSRQQLFSESIAVILMVSLSAAGIAAVSRFFGSIVSSPLITALASLEMLSHHGEGKS